MEAFLAITTDGTDDRTAASQIRHLPGVKSLVITSGKFDAVARVTGSESGQSALEPRIQRIREVETVSSVEVLPIVRAATKQREALIATAAELRGPEGPGPRGW